MKPVSADRRLFIVDVTALCAMALIAGAVYAWHVGPRLADAAALEERRAILVQRNEEAQQASQNLRKTQGHLEEIRATAAREPVRLKRPDEINSRLAELTALADGLDSGALRIEQINPGGPIKGARYSVVPIRLAGEGSYVACAEFLARLHSQFLDTAVTGYSLAQDASRDDGRARFSVDLAWSAAPWPPLSRPEAGAARAGVEPSK